MKPMTYIVYHPPQILNQLQMAKNESQAPIEATI
jgi:hypothetical protein